MEKKQIKEKDAQAEKIMLPLLKTLPIPTLSFASQVRVGIHDAPQHPQTKSGFHLACTAFTWIAF